MANNSIPVTRRQLLGGLITVGSAGIATGAGTMAAFSDSESSSGNTIQAGTLDLDFDSSRSFSFDTALTPSETTTDSVTLVRDGSITGSLDVDVSYTENDASSNSTDMTAPQVARNLDISTLTYGSTDLSGDSQLTLDDLANNGLINLDDPGSDGTHFTVGLRLQDVGNDFQGDGIAITFEFHLKQNDSQ